MWFKNALIYRITKPLDWSIDTLAPQLEQHRYQPCAQSDILNAVERQRISVFCRGQTDFIACSKRRKNVAGTRH